MTERLRAAVREATEGAAMPGRAAELSEESRPMSGSSLTAYQLVGAVTGTPSPG